MVVDLSRSELANTSFCEVVPIALRTRLRRPIGTPPYFWVKIIGIRNVGETDFAASKSPQLCLTALSPIQLATLVVSNPNRRSWLQDHGDL